MPPPADRSGQGTSPASSRPGPLHRARMVLFEAADMAAFRARKLLRTQLTAARRSDSLVRRRAYLVARQAARAGINTLTSRQVGWVATLWQARWLEGTQYEITGWAYERGHGYEQHPQVRVLLRRPGSTVSVEARVEARDEMEINGFPRYAEHDYANTAFTATLDLAQVLEDQDPEPWQVHLEVTGADGKTRRGTLKYRHRRSSARFLGARTFEGDVQLVPTWRRGRGWFVQRREPVAIARSVVLDGRELTAEVALRGLAPVRAELVSRHARRPVQLLAGASPDLLRLEAQIPVTWVVDDLDWADEESHADEAVIDASGPDTPETRDSVEDAGAEHGRGAPEGRGERVGQRVKPQTYHLILTDAAGEEHLVASGADGHEPIRGRTGGMLAYAGGRGQLCVSDSTGALVVTAVELKHDDGPSLRLGGTWAGAVEQVGLRLTGTRQDLEVEAALEDDHTWSATVALRQSQWGGPPTLPRTGSYTLRATDAPGAAARILCAPAVIGATPTKLDLAGARLRLEVGRGRALVLRVGVARAADELGSFHQRRLDQHYLGVGHHPAQSIYFESFYGRLATCNPYAIDRIVARDHPEWTRYWGVTDSSVAVPPGAIPVVEGTREWFEARTRSRYVIANDWLRRRFVPQPFQTVLQTWHGSMFKRIGLDRPHVAASTREALEHERDKWDILLSQNQHSSVIFGSAYAWDGPVYEEGYPRNDPLSTGSGEQIRARLGIRPDQTVILYAPTWRDNVQGLSLFLDLPRLREDLGDDYVLLLRGHTRTLGHGASIQHDGVIDVSTYPHVTELFLAADAMITDYSSVMFDFSVTGRPIIFYTPDLDEYRDDIRGVYFDLAEEAPGPVVSTQHEVVAAIRAMGDTERYAGRYHRWREKFNALDDGHSAERVVRRLFGEGGRAGQRLEEGGRDPEE